MSYLIRIMLKLRLTSILTLLVFYSCKNDKVADTIFINGIIWTANQEFPVAEAMAIHSDTIMAIGDSMKILSLIGSSTEIIDLKNKFVTPGFIDTHVHLLMGGNSLLSVQLRNADTKKEFIKRIKEHAITLEPDQWIVEGNWDHTLWGGELPSKEWIDEFTNENPTAVYRMDGHMILANSAALKIAGINKNTSEIENGEIVRDKNGEPTGILKSEAMNLVLNKIPALNTLQKYDAINKAQQYLLSNGVTSIHDVDSLGGLEVLKKMHESNTLNIRVYSADPLYDWSISTKSERLDNKYLKNGLLKGFMDGSLGSHTAAFSESYADRPDDKGLMIAKRDSMLSWIRHATLNDFQVTVHAIGDEANHQLLNVYEEIIDANKMEDLRFRIEHAQHLRKSDINRFSNLNVIASMQPYHAIDDGRWAEKLIGPKRIKTTYAFKSLLDENTKLVFGSDWPVAPASPILGMYAAVTRKTLDGLNPYGWVPEQKISIEQSLYAYTKDAAYSSYDEDDLGSLDIGKLADFVILSDDLTKINSDKIKDVKVLATYVGGKQVYENN